MNRNFNKRNVIIYFLIAISILGNYFLAGKILNLYSLVIQPLTWLFILILSNLLLYDGSNRQKKAKDKFQIIVIVCLIYFLIYFLSGLFFGFARSIYSHSFINVIKNIYIYLSIIILKECVRDRLIKNSGNSFINFILITILFILTDISFYNFASYLSSSEIIFKYSFQVIVPIIFSNITYTYLASLSNYKTTIFYRSFIILMKILAPIQPAYDWFLSGLVESVLAIVIFYIFRNYQMTKVERNFTIRRKKEKGGLISKFVIITFVVFYVLFVGGFFKYQPLAVVSGSMEPVFSRGDVLIIEKIDEKDLKNLEKGYIIAYKKDNIIVTHRIVDIKYTEATNRVLIKTKGDNNNNVDNFDITNDNIVGIVRKIIPYVGYPSVFIGELLNG